MRGLLFLAVVLAIAVRMVGAAQAGVLGWTWLTLMIPQKLAWGFVTELPLNLVIAIFTFLAWFLSREPKRMQINSALVIWLGFALLLTLTTFFSLAPELAWPRWSLAIKVMVLGFVVVGVMTTQVRIHALVWVIALSLGYYGVKGGIFTILTGGHFRVLAPADSLGDNNNLALALCMVLPLMNYLRQQSRHRFMRVGIIAAMGLTALAVLGTYSRGGFLGLAIMSVYLWWHSRNRIAIAVVALGIAVPAYLFMPANWTERMGTIENAESDSSFQDRLEAWKTAFNIAKARPIVGGGFNASESPMVYQKFSGDPTAHPRAAHSIYFEVLGDHGFFGLGLFVALLAVTWHYAGRTRRRAARDPNFQWIADLAAMIQVSLVSFIVAGAALSMAYYDMFYLLIGITIVLRGMILHSKAAMPIAQFALPAVG